MGTTSVSKCSIVTKISYPDTLKDIQVGETRTYEMVGTLYNGMKTAISRLNNSGNYHFDSETDHNSNLLIVTRIK